MGDIGLLKQGWRSFQSQKKFFLPIQALLCALKEKLGFLIEQHWPFVWTRCINFSRILVSILCEWKNCVTRGFISLLKLGSVSLFIILWGFYLCYSTAAGVVYAHLTLGGAAIGIHYLGHTPGIFIVGIFAIFFVWINGKLWITGLVLVAGGCMLSVKQARMLMLVLTTYVLYSVTTRVGYAGVIIALNLSFLSDELFSRLLHSPNPQENRPHEAPNEEPTQPDPFFEYSTTHTGHSHTENCTDTPASAHFDTESDKTEAESKPCRATSAPSVLCSDKDKSLSEKVGSGTVVRNDVASADEIERIFKGANHYEVLGIPRTPVVDTKLMKKHYHKMVLLVHPDKNMGNARACESFKKLQCAYEVLSDFTKKYNYDEQLRKEESRRSTSQRSRNISQKGGVEFLSEESRRIECTKCGNFHVWICTRRRKSQARWCQSCCQYHQARDGDGWVENGSSPLFSPSLKVDIPRAFVCAESKIFDVSEWAICQGMECRPNTHGPSFMVNMVGPDKSSSSSSSSSTNHRCGSSRYPWGLDAEKVFDDDEFELWLQQALASGVFPETPKRRKSWTSPFKLNQKGIKGWSSPRKR
ncbi:hypothetical protein LUZ60_005129 [Juncus effusus]|nr:hypothetical protein LUZ60_005129 [Juncus effusus]